MKNLPSLTETSEDKANKKWFEHYNTGPISNEDAAKGFGILLSHKAHKKKKTFWTIKPSIIENSKKNGESLNLNSTIIYILNIKKVE